MKLSKEAIVELNSILESEFGIRDSEVELQVIGQNLIELVRTLLAESK